MHQIKQIQFLTLAIMLLIIGACVDSNPIARAETVEQRAYAAYGTFVIFEEQAAKLVSSGQLSPTVIQRIARADASAKEVADSLLDATLGFEKIRDEFNQGITTEEKYLNAMANLNSWIEQAIPLVNNLVSVVKEVT